MTKTDKQTISWSEEENAIGRLSRDLYKESTIQGYAHMNAADYWGGSNLFIGLAITGLSAAVSASIFSHYAILAVVAEFFSLCLVVISSVSTFLNPDQRANSHQKAKALYQGLADKAQALYRVDLELRKKDVEELCKEYEQLLKEMDQARKSSPRLPIRHLDHANAEWERKNGAGP